MSSDQGPGAPSFGDLFDDPDAPEAPAAPVTVPGHGAAPAVAEQPSPAGQAQPATGAADLVTGHDLDHESAEAAHLVAGFEPDDSARDIDDTPEPGRGLYDSVMIAPLGTAMADEPASPAAAALRSSETPAPVTVAPAPWDGTVDPAISSAPATRVDTGRLYRSSGAEGPATLDAIPAIDPGHSPARRVETLAAPSKPTSGLTYTGVAVVVITATVVAAFIDALLRKEIGAITGLALAASSIYSAVVVRRADIWAAVVIPPLAFLAAALTAGQLTIDKSGNRILGEGLGLFRILAINAPWILGTTLVCLVIVLVRRRRA